MICSRRALLVGLPAALFVATDAKACECPYYDENARAEMFVESIAHAAGAIQGIVTRPTNSLLANGAAIVRPTHIWFGEKREQYLIKSRSMCDEPLYAGQKVALLLFPLPPDQSIIGQLAFLFRAGEPLHAAEACANFSQALHDPRVKKALKLRASQPH